MSGSLNELFAASVLFVAGHFILSSVPVRMALVGRLGETRFLVAYSVVILAIFVWMLLAFSQAPTDPAWAPPPALQWLPLIGMPLALFLVVCGLTTPSPTLAGTKLDEPGRDLTQGIIRVTRHPFLNGVSLWAILHLLANGESRSVVLFTAMLVLSVGGMWHIDKRREFHYGADWGPVMLTTSAVPFAALITGRTTMDWAGIGWWRVLASVAAYVAIVAVHGLVIGVPAFPAP
ncbi:MAG: NnrU family protein [Alphaproteobacteria bacterium]|nr:NnrU family protein [Alphaproteobacteria bacterium]